MLKVTKVLDKHFPLTTRSSIIDASLPKQTQQNLRYYEQALSDLTAQIALLGKVSSEIIGTKNEFLNEKQTALDKKFELKTKALEEEHQKKNSELAEKEDALRKKVDAFETRDSKFVRRDLLGKMRELIGKQSEIKLSRATSVKRRIIHLLCGLGIIAAIILTGWFGIQYSRATTHSWFDYAPIATGILLFVTTLIYYIMWNNDWYREHAEAEFRNKRLDEDILRASWVAELLFEWDKERVVSFLKVL